MNAERLEQTLPTLHQTARLIQQRGAVERWRFEADGRTYFLDFYSARDGSAARAFATLQTLQQAKVPAVRAVAHVAGFRFGQRTGDALVLHLPGSSETATTGLELPGSMRQRHADGRALTALLVMIANARFDCPKLSVGHFVRCGTRLLVGHVDQFTPGRLGREAMLHLVDSLPGGVSACESLRAWRAVIGTRLPPVINPVSKRRWSGRDRSPDRTPRFVHFRLGDFDAVMLARLPDPTPPWSRAARLRPEPHHWEQAWSTLHTQIESSQITRLKHDRNGDVWRGQVRLGGETIDVIVKRPLRKHAYRRLLDFGPFARAARQWHKAYKLLARGFACELPLLRLTRTTFGVVRESYVVIEAVPGPTLADYPLDTLTPPARRTLLHRAARVERRLDDLGFAHFDAKSTNWIVIESPGDAPTPVMIDVDGVRHYRWRGFGIRRLIRAMRAHPQVNDADLVHLARGYDRFGSLERIARLSGVEPRRVREVER